MMCAIARVTTVLVDRVTQVPAVRRMTDLAVLHTAGRAVPAAIAQAAPNTRVPVDLHITDRVGRDTTVQAVQPMTVRVVRHLRLPAVRAMPVPEDRATQDPAEMGSAVPRYVGD